ncbi:MAG: MerR family transcriptional regulator [Amylibacter sp.]
MRISEISERTGLSISAIRYYEESGLCPFVERGADGNRKFTTVNLDWLVLLSSLRETGMPMSEMRAFAMLYKIGDDTAVERKTMLLKHQNRLEDRQGQLDRCSEILDRKLAKYDEII